MVDKILKTILCTFKFHRLEYDNHILLKSQGVRVVVYRCPICGDHTVKEYKLHVRK